MEVRRLELKDFRNYEHQQVSFDPQLNLIAGMNGQGKTNLLEAVHVLSGQGSHRSSTPSALVRHGAAAAVLRSRCQAAGRELAIDVEIKASGGSRMLVNKVPIEKVPGRDPGFTCVIFSPEDLALVKGGPEERRRYLDQVAAKRRPLAAASRHEFDRALRQRNGVLKAGLSNPRALRQLEVWTEQMVKFGSEVIRHRLETLAEAAPVAQDHYRHISAAETGPVLRYEASWAQSAPDANEDVARLLADAVTEVQPREIERGVTLVGPQRDDLGLDLGGADARAFASQGEQRSIALALRLAEKDLVTEARGRRPVLLLDDVFSELDDRRRAQLAILVAEHGQTIATATSAEGLPLKEAKLMRIDSGRLIEDA